MKGAVIKGAVQARVLEVLWGAVQVLCGTRCCSRRCYPKMLFRCCSARRILLFEVLSRCCEGAFQGSVGRQGAVQGAVQGGAVQDGVVTQHPSSAVKVLYGVLSRCCSLRHAGSRQGAVRVLFEVLSRGCSGIAVLFFERIYVYIQRGIHAQDLTRTTPDLLEVAELLRYHTSKSGDEQISLSLGFST